MFDRLDRWRHLPAYQLERRADIFFAVYLPEVIAESVGVALHDVVLPELPIKRDLIWPDKPTNQSVKLDYCLFSKDLSRAFFVELKTDAGSRRQAQDEYLRASERLGFGAIAEGVRQIALASTSRQKYLHLLTALGDLGFLEVPSEIEGLAYPRPQRGLTKSLDDIRTTAQDASVEVIYVQPEDSPGVRCVDFETFASFVERHEDPLSRRFAESLRRWTVPAGGTSPRVMPSV